MRVDKINSQNFQAKHPKIREMDKVLRIMNSSYPTFSTSKFLRANPVDNNTIAKHKLALKGVNLCLDVRNRLVISRNQDSPLEHFRSMLSIIRNHKMANCSELVNLFNFIAGLNGTKALRACLCPSDIDHVVSIIPLTKKAQKTDFSKTPLNKMRDIIIADPWLGIVDFAPNIAIKYKSEFNKIIGSPENYMNYDRYVKGLSLDKFYLNPLECTQNPEITKDIKKFFKKVNPHLFFTKNGKNLIKR